MTRDAYIADKVRGHIGDQQDYKARLRALYGEMYDTSLKDGGKKTVAEVNAMSDASNDLYVTNGLVVKMTDGGDLDNDETFESAAALTVAADDTVVYRVNVGWEKL